MVRYTLAYLLILLVLPSLWAGMPPPLERNVWDTNANPTITGDGTTASGTRVLTLKNTGTAGEYTKVTFDAQGRETSGTTLSFSDIPDLSGTYLSLNAGGILFGNLSFGNPTTAEIFVGGSAVFGGAGQFQIDSSGNLIAPSIRGSNLSASTALVSDSESPPKIVSSTTTATELGYVHNVTNAIQTQIDAKGSGTVTSVSASGPAGVTWVSSGSGAVTLTGTTPGFIETNKNVNAICLFTNNGVSIDINSSGIVTLTNYAAAGLGFVWSTNGSGTNTGNLKMATAHVTGASTFGGAVNVSGRVTATQFLNNGANGESTWFAFANGPTLVSSSATTLKVEDVNGNLGGVVSCSNVTTTIGGVSWAAATLVTLTNVVVTNVTLDFPSTAAGTTSDLLVNVANVNVGDFAFASPPAGSMQANSMYSAWVSNTFVYVRFHNDQLVSAIDPASGTFRVKLEQWK